MALTWRRGVAQSERGSYARPDPIAFGQPGQPADDYLVQTEIRAARPPVALQAFRVLRLVLIAIIAVLSLAVFWVIGLILGIF